MRGICWLGWAKRAHRMRRILGTRDGRLRYLDPFAPPRRRIGRIITPNQRRAVAVATFDECAALVSRLQTQIRRVFIGQDEVVKQVLTACFAGGHVLLRGVPGLAKTLLIKTLAQAVAPQVQPRPVHARPDAVRHHRHGSHRGRPRQRPSGVIRFIPGPIFANMILADEINRTPPKTQAALLEAMQEHQVTVNGVRYALDARRSSCWRRRIPSSRRAPIRCPRRSSIGSCSTW